ncbi:MAG TPA: phage holin family protein [Candidatus Acidoferrales bacterium]|nr:phage holin family protein [Candidatus Acidoferrales bacterium]
MNIPEVGNAAQSRSPSAVSQLVFEIGEFIQTRSDLLKAAIRQQLPSLRIAILLGMTGGILLLAAYLLFTIAIVVLVGSAFPANPYRCFFGFLVVGVFSAGAGAIGVFLTKSELTLRSALPKRTLRVLKGDRKWMMSEIQQHK